MAKRLLDEQIKTLIEYGYKESDIPLTHKYWANKSRIMQATSATTDPSRRLENELEVQEPPTEEVPVEEVPVEEPVEESVEEPEPPVETYEAKSDFGFLTDTTEENQ